VLQDNNLQKNPTTPPSKTPVSSAWEHHVGANPTRALYEDKLQVSIGENLLREKLKIYVLIGVGLFLTACVLLLEFTVLSELRKLYVDPTKLLAFMSWKVTLLSSSSLFLVIMTILQTFYAVILLQKYKKEQLRERHIWEMYFLFLCDTVIFFLFLLFPIILFFLPILSVILPQE
jgi:hypothetical protein